MKLIKKILKLILNIICLITILIIILGLSYIIQITVMNKKYANIFGYSLFEVLTGSMEPTIGVGDDVLIKVTQDIKKGDVVVFDNKGNDNFLLHRVIEINENNVITKGDNNNTYDGVIPKENIIGKTLVVFPKLGRVQEFFRKPYIFIPLIDFIIISTLFINYKKKYS